MKIPEMNYEHFSLPKKNVIIPQNDGLDTRMECKIQEIYFFLTNEVSEKILVEKGDRYSATLTISLIQEATKNK
jgi:hypothetical protein